MQLFKATFSGKHIGAIGISEMFYNVPVIAQCEDDARLALYAKYDHIMIKSINPDEEFYVVQSFYDESIFICIANNGWHLMKGLSTGSPVELIADEGVRKLIILEANTEKGYQKPLQEFKQGGIVHFQAYDEVIKAKVKKVYKPDNVSFLFGSNMYTYELSGINKPLITRTTGRSIQESVYFADPEKFPFKFN